MRFYLALLFLIPFFSIAYSAKLVVYGSSVARGWNASPLSNGYSGLLETHLESGTWIVENEAVPGYNTTNARANFTSDVVPHNPNIVYIGLSLGNEGLSGAGDPDAVFESFRTGMLALIDDCRNNGFYPVIGLNYPRNTYSLANYEYVKRMNRLMNTWDVPSVNLLGALDDGSGQFISGYWDDALHPNNIGHAEMYHSFVPSLFDAIEAGDTTPPVADATTDFARISYDVTQSAPISFSPSGTMHSFNVAFRVRTTGIGTVAAIQAGASYATVEVRDTEVVYIAPTGQEISASIDANGGQWIDVAVAHRWAAQQTDFFVDGSLAGSRSEQYAPSLFVLGGPSGSGRAISPASADYKDWCVYRAPWTVDEALAQTQGAFQQASLDVYAPLTDASFSQGANTVNEAQSLSSAIINTPAISAQSGVLRPDGLAAISTQEGMVELTWNDNSTTETGYIVERRPDDASTLWSIIATLPANRVSYSDATPSPGESFAYRVSTSEGSGLRSDYSISAAVDVFINEKESFRYWISQYYAAEPATYLIDFNQNMSADYGGVIWNTITSLSDASPYPLVDAANDDSAAYLLTITDAFDQFRSGNGQPLSDYDNDAQSTLFVSTTSSPGKGEITLSNLNPHSLYDFVVYARRGTVISGFDYRGQYRFSGGSTDVSFEMDTALSAETVEVINLQADTNGEIKIAVAPPDTPTGSIFAGISFLVMKEHPAPGPFLIDFNASANPVYPAGQSWNTISSLSNGNAYSLVNAYGDASSGYTLSLADDFDQFRDGNNDLPLGFASAAESTCFALRDDTPMLGRIVLGGLDPNYAYDIRFLAARGNVLAGFDYSGTYTFTGEGPPQVLIVDGAGNTEYTDVTGIVPSVGGTITIDVESGPNAGTDFPVLNLLRLAQSGRKPGANSVAAVSDDPDADSIDNFAEYALGLNPSVQNEPFNMDDINVSTGQMRFSYTRKANTTGVTYTVERTDSLTTPNWLAEPSATESTQPDGGDLEHVEVQVLPSATRSYYRLSIDY